MKYISQYLRRAQTRRELMSLTDRELADIGLNRGCIEAVIRGEYQ